MDEADESALRAQLTPGTQVRALRDLWHIRAIIDGDQVVYRRWSKRKQRWVYGCDPLYVFWLYIQNGMWVVLTRRDADGEV